MPPDYSGQNLRGRSFKGQNLTDSNFSKADIRGANFTNAILKGANFSGATAGLQRRWVIALLIVTFILSALLGLFSVLIGGLLPLICTSVPILGIVHLIIVTFFSIVIIHEDLIVLAKTGIVTLAFAFAIALAGGVYGAFEIAFVVSLAFAGACGGFLVFLGSVAFVKVLVKFEDFFKAFVFAGVFAVAFTFIGNLVGFENFFTSFTGSNKVPNFAEIIALSGSLIFVLFNVYIGWRSFTRDEKDPWLRSFAISFVATGGTNFRGADLTDTDFTGATLKNTDFRTANLTRTRFYKAKKLDLASPGNTILNNRAVLNLLVTLNGRNKSYTGANLRGANLIGANLKESNLKDAEISETTFEGACLEGTNLTLTQAVGTNFTKAQMTGVCVEAWNIESTTIFDNVDCRFVYLLEYSKPGTDDRERRPSSGEFQPGEFTKLFEEVLNTVDLIFRDGINWQAFVNAFKKVQVENGDTELAIQSIENKGDGVVVVKVAVPDNADKEKIHSDFTQNYQLALAAVEEKYKAQLQAKDNEIVIYRQQSAEMTEIVKLLANKPINVQVDNKVENKNMTNSNDSSRNVEVEMNIQKVEGGVAGKVMGNQVITPKQNLADSASEIQQLLQILNQSYPADIPTDTQAEIEVAVKGINKNPELKERVIGALTAGGIEAIKELADNIYVNVLIAAYDGWKNPQS